MLGWHRELRYSKQSSVCGADAASSLVTPLMGGIHQKDNLPVVIKMFN